MNLKIALVAIAKMENDYIDEWIQYHLNLGFDHVFLYDNNDPKYEYVGDRISANKDKVSIIPFPTIGINTQELAYTDCYKNYGDEFDWMAFFDIDEFLVLNDGIDLKTKLKTIVAENVLIPWKIYTWSGRFSRDVKSPVMNDFKDFVSADSDIVKSIVKTKLSNLLEHGINVHGQYGANTYSDINGNMIVPTVPHGTKKGVFTRTKFSYFENLGGCRVANLNHYWSKSLDEFLRFKWARQYLNENLHIGNRLYRYCKKEDVDKVKKYIKKHQLLNKKA